MEAEKFKKGIEIQKELEALQILRKNYQKICENKITQDSQYVYIGNNGDSIRIITEKRNLPELNEIFHDELKRFLQIMNFRIEDQISKKELEFKNL